MDALTTDNVIFLKTSCCFRPHYIEVSRSRCLLDERGECGEGESLWGGREQKELAYFVTLCRRLPLFLYIGYASKEFHCALSHVTIKYSIPYFLSKVCCSE